MVNLPDPDKGCPDWCQEIGDHATHHRRWGKITVTGGARPLGIRLGLLLPSRHRRPRIEMMIYRGASEVMRFYVGGEQADSIARDLTKAALVARTSDLDQARRTNPRRQRPVGRIRGGDGPQDR